jgi:hypothetical protein
MLQTKAYFFHNCLYFDYMHRFARHSAQHDTNWAGAKPVDTEAGSGFV